MDVNDRSMFPFTGEDAFAFVERVFDALQLTNESAFADMDIKPPGLEITRTGGQYYDPSRNIIHIGTDMLVEIFHPADEAEFLSLLNYMLGHEQQHRRSTADRPYALAIQQGCEAVLEYIQSQVEPFKRRFRKPADYAQFADITLPGLGIWISWNKIRKIVSHIVNALEDGRIERIRSARLHGFAVLTTRFRGIDWDRDEPVYMPYEVLERLHVVYKLKILTAQIASLATCQIYQKGFVSAYSGTPLMAEAEQYIPHIAKAVMAGKTRGLQSPVKNICRLLAPYLYESCKAASEDDLIKQAMEDMLADMIKQAVDEMPEGNSLSEKTEDTDDGGTGSPFPFSDLTVTLDDETYDKLMERSQNSDHTEGGIKVRREHPLPGQDADEEAAGQSPESASERQTDTQSSTQAGTKESASADRSDETAGTAPESVQSDTDPSGTSAPGHAEQTSGGKTPPKETEEIPSEGRSEAAEAENRKDPLKGMTEQRSGQNGGQEREGSEQSPSEPSGVSENARNGKAKEKKHVGRHEADAAAEAVRQAMRQAADESRAEAETTLNAVNTSIGSATRAAGRREQKDVEQPLSAESMKDICDFRELKREYKVRESLPAVLMQRGKVLKRKNEQYFKSLSTPNVSFLDSGTIDPARIYSLGMGDTEIFRKKGKDKVFDGCAYILIDNSGSMSGNKRMEACKAAAVIEEGFRGIMPFKIVAFDYAGVVIHEVVKGWEESLNKNCCWNFAKSGREGCGNEDMFDIQIAERELLARPESKKLLLVLSDGAPGDTTGCRDAIRHARKAGIQVTGIYFEEGECDSNETFEFMYEKEFICCGLAQLDAELIKVLKKFSRS